MAPNHQVSVRRVQVTPEPVNILNVFPEADENEVPDHLRDLYERSIIGKDVKQQRVVAGLLKKYGETFSKAEWDIGLTNLAEHSIDTGNAPPIKQRPRRVPMAYAEEEKKAIEELHEKGVIRKSTSPWASPIVLVRKKSGAIRPCVDYRKLNALVKPDGFPMPRIQDCLDAVAGSSLFSSFDLTSGYFQIPLKESDRPKSAFVCKYGLFEMTRMPFGLNNSSCTFQRTMELVLQGLQWVTCLVYIDDVVVFGKDFEQHILRVDQVLDRMKQAGLKLRPDKCNMLQSEVVFLGHIVSQDGVLPDTSNVEKIANWPTPVNEKQVKQFVATGSYYRRFIKDFAKVARPLFDLTKKDAVFLWDSRCEDAFQHIKRALMGPEVMGYPLNDGGEFVLDTDASGVGIGAVLAQVQEGRERVIAYGSRSFNKAEKNYCITEQELLAVVFFVQYFRQYLLGRRFLVRTDHQALVWLFSLKEPSSKIARWIEILAPYDFGIEYRPGKKHGHCDALSRCATPKDCTCSEVDMSEPLKCGPCQKCKRRSLLMQYQLKQCDGQEPKEDDEQCKAVVRVVRSPQPAKHEQASTSTSIKVESGGQCWLYDKTPAETAAEQSKDPDIAVILKAKREGIRPSKSDKDLMSQETRHYWILWEQLLIVIYVLCKTFVKRNGTGQFY